MNGMRRKIAGKTPAEIREMSKEEMKEPITMEDFIQVGGVGGDRVQYTAVSTANQYRATQKKQPLAVPAKRQLYCQTLDPLKPHWICTAVMRYKSTRCC